jgi:hypothetical protein
VDEGFALYRGLSTPPVFWPALLMIHATALAGAGRIDEARAVILEAEAVAQSGDPVIVDVLIVRSDLELALDPTARVTAEGKLEEAAAIARRRSARAGLVRALTRLATLRRGTPEGQAALDELRDVYDRLPEGRDLSHMVEARAVLDG